MQTLDFFQLWLLSLEEMEKQREWSEKQVAPRLLFSVLKRTWAGPEQTERYKLVLQLSFPPPSHFWTCCATMVLFGCQLCESKMLVKKHLPKDPEFICIIYSRTDSVFFPNAVVIMPMLSLCKDLLTLDQFNLSKLILLRSIIPVTKQGM